MNSIRKLIKKYQDVLIYLFFGMLTTVVNFAIYLPCFHILNFSGASSNMIAWGCAVTFAYLTNKPFVFRSHDWSRGTVFQELIKFVGSRVASGGFETAIIFVTVDCLQWDGIVMKFATSVIVVVMNYVTSKFLVFRKEEGLRCPSYFFRNVSTFSFVYDIINKM